MANALVDLVKKGDRDALNAYLSNQTISGDSSGISLNGQPNNALTALIGGQQAPQSMPTQIIPTQKPSIAPMGITRSDGSQVSMQQPMNTIQNMSTGQYVTPQGTQTTNVGQAQFQSAGQNSPWDEANPQYLDSGGYMVRNKQNPNLLKFVTNGQAEIVDNTPPPPTTQELQRQLLQQKVNEGNAPAAPAQPNAPSGYRYNAAGNLEFIPGGPADPDTKQGQLSNREAVYVSRVANAANEAAQALKNVVQLPMSASTGFFGGRQQGGSLLDAGKEALTNKMTSQDVQSYNTLASGFQRNLAAIEAAGLAPSGTLSHQMDSVMFKEGDTNFTKLQKLAEIKQIVNAGMETTLSNPRIPQQQRDHIQQVMDQINQAVPFNQTDLIKMQQAQQTNPDMTIRDVISSNQPNTARVPQTGQVYKGFVFLGGNPSDPARWRKQ